MSNSLEKTMSLFEIENQKITNRIGKTYEPETWMDTYLPSYEKRMKQELAARADFPFHTFYKLDNPVIAGCKNCGFRGCVIDPVVGILNI